MSRYFLISTDATGRFVNLTPDGIAQSEDAQCILAVFRFLHPARWFVLHPAP